MTLSDITTAKIYVNIFVKLYIASQMHKSYPDKQITLKVSFSETRHVYWSDPSSSSSSSCSSSVEAASFLGGAASLRGLPRPLPSPEPP